jgi:hypothetical protein
MCIVIAVVFLSKELDAKAQVTVKKQLADFETVII